MGCGEGFAGASTASNFSSSGEENQNVAAMVFLQQQLERSGHLVFERLRRIRLVSDGEVEQPAFGTQDGGAVQEVCDGSGLEGGGHHDQFQVGPGGGLQSLEEGQCEIGFEVTLVELVEDDGADAVEVGVGEKAPCQNTFGQETEAGSWAGDLFKSNLVADGFAEFFAKLLGDAAGCEPGCNAAGLEDQDVAGDFGQQGGRNSRGLAGARRRLYDEVWDRGEPGDGIGDNAIDGQVRTVQIFWRQHGTIHSIVGPQETIAHYRITAKLGEGGMGEVWRAVDTKLGRDVAIKILPEVFSRDEDRMTRFTRESQVLASLNHPNIAAIYGVEERALVMELVEGPTLAEHAAQGPMDLDEVLPIVEQMIDALEYAHEKGVVHRDLKPANIKITPEGRVKLLDFGLAKAMGNEPAATDAMTSPTLTMKATVAGVIMGTAAYMSPEQARGRSVDKRADIWAFGVVVYEMLTGRRLFAGPTISDTLAGVLKQEPEWGIVPFRVRKLLRLCLAKDARRRLRDIGDARALIDAEEPARDQVVAGRRGRLPYFIAAVLAIGVAVLAGMLWLATRPVEHPFTRLSVDLGPNAVTGVDLTVAISPDGRRMVFPVRAPNGKQMLATRRLEDAQAAVIEGTEDGADPFFSPDGQWLGFFSDGKMKKISISGGTAVALCVSPNPRGASWGEDGNIIAALNLAGPLERVPASGGVPQALTKMLPGEATHRWPQVIPGADAVIYTASPNPVRQDDASVVVYSWRTGETKIVQRGAYYGRYLPSGHVLFTRQGALFGIRFDLAHGITRGLEVPLLEDLAANPISGGGQFHFSQSSGTLLYLSGKAAGHNWLVSWLDSSGKTGPLIATPGPYTVPKISPDGKKLAFTGKGGDLYAYDLERQTAARVTIGGNARTPVWAPDGKHMAFGTGATISWVRSDGSGEPQRLLEGGITLAAWSFSPDGKLLAYFVTMPDTGTDIWLLPLDLTDPDKPRAGAPQPFLRTKGNEMAPQFSPDGRWIAYRSDESGSIDIYVRPAHPGAAGKWQISSEEGGLYPLWSKNGHELFYETLDRRIMVVDYTVSGDRFVPGKSRVWSNLQLPSPGVSNLDLAPDGKRFAVLTTIEAATEDKSSVHITMLENFFNEVKRKIP